jgi:hypothetical protein
MESRSDGRQLNAQFMPSLRDYDSSAAWIPGTCVPGYPMLSLRDFELRNFKNQASDLLNTNGLRYNSVLTQGD